MPKKDMTALSARWVNEAAEPGSASVADDTATVSNDRSLAVVTAAMVPATDLWSDAGDGSVERFDYGMLKPSSRLSLLENERQLDEIERVATVAAGRILRSCQTAILAEVGWGYWHKWLYHRRLKRTTANGRIRAAAWADESAIVTDLPAGVLHRAAGALDYVKQQIIQRLAAGETIQLRHVEELLKREKAGKEEERIGKLTPEQAEREALKRTEAEAHERAIAENSRRHADEREKRRISLAGEVIDKLRSAFDDAAIGSLVEMWSFAFRDEMVRLLQNGGVRANLWKYVN